MEPTYAGFKNKYAYIGFKNKYAYTGLGMCTQKPKGDYVVSSLRTQAWTQKGVHRCSSAPLDQNHSSYPFSSQGISSKPFAQKNPRIFKTKSKSKHKIKGKLKKWESWENLQIQPVQCEKDVV